MKAAIGITLLLCAAIAGTALASQVESENPGDGSGGSAAAPAVPSAERHLSEFDFGMHLFQTKDYYRAISAFKRYEFFQADSAATNLAGYMIPLSEYAAGRFGEAVGDFEAYGTLATSSRLRDASVFYMGQCWEELGEHEAAQTTIRSANPIDPDIRERSAIALVWSELSAGEWRDARASARRYKELFPAGPNAHLVDRIDREVADTRPFGQKHVAYGALLSLIPGGGQFYAGHVSDALNTCLMVGAATALAIHGAREDSSTTLTFGITIAGALYIGNIYGGANAVSVTNARKREAAMQSFRTELESSTFNRLVLP
jgi:hypothetical protein